MGKVNEIWPHGVPEVGAVAERLRAVKVKTTVTRDDGTVVLDGEALCYRMALP